MMIESKSDFRYSHLRSLLVGRSVNYFFQNTSNEKCALLMGIPFAIIMLAVAVTGAFQSFDGIEIVMGSTAVNIFIGIILLFHSRYIFF